MFYFEQNLHNLGTQYNNYTYKINFCCVLVLSKKDRAQHNAAVNCSADC